MAFLRAYFDESGTHDGSLFTVVGGGLARESTWLAIAGQWRSALRKYGASAFHSTDFSNSRKEFAGWDEAKRRNFIGALLNIITNESITLIVSSVPNQTFDTVVQEFPDLTMTPYHYCCEMCMHKIGFKLQTKKRVEPVAVTFEAGQKANSPVFGYFFARMNDAGWQKLYRIKSVDFLSKKEAIPLQVADLIAYEYYKGLTLSEISPEKPLRFPLMKLCEKIGIAEGGTPGEATIRNYLRLPAALEEFKSHLCPSDAKKISQR